MFKVTNCDLQKDIHMTDKNSQDITLQGFVNDIKTIINTARTNAVRSVDFCRVQMYWAISPQEIIKDPMVLEFLGLERKASYYEKDLESAIISHIADFLLEMGKGFSFVARQKRLLIEDERQVR